MEKETRVICGFAGVGKTYYTEHNKNLKIKDSKLPHLADLKEYLEDIKELIESKEYDIIFMPDDHEIKMFLSSNYIEFEHIFPERDLKEEYLQRYKNGDRSEEDTKFLESNWYDLHHDHIRSKWNPENKFSRRIKLQKGDTISSYFKNPTKGLVNSASIKKEWRWHQFDNKCDYSPLQIVLLDIEEKEGKNKIEMPVVINSISFKNPSPWARPLSQVTFLQEYNKENSFDKKDGLTPIEMKLNIDGFISRVPIEEKHYIQFKEMEDSKFFYFVEKDDYGREYQIFPFADEDTNL